MATPIDQIGFHELAPTLRALEKAGGTTEHSDWIRSGQNARLFIKFIDEQLDRSDKNPYEMTVEQQIGALILANYEEKWGIPEEDFARLVATAPAWPKGEHAYRSFRIRFGEWGEGVALTFERQLARITSVFGESGFWYRRFLTDRKRLRLLKGNQTHKPVIEWIVADLDTHRKRDSVTAVRGPKSLADELLVIAWLFPDMIRAIDYDKLPGLLAAGYEVKDADYGEDAWQGVVIVAFSRDESHVSVCPCGCGSDGSDFSVPVLRESPALGT